MFIIILFVEQGDGTHYTCRRYRQRSQTPCTTWFAIAYRSELCKYFVRLIP